MRASHLGRAAVAEGATGSASGAQGLCFARITFRPRCCCGWWSQGAKEDSFRTGVRNDDGSSAVAGADAALKAATGKM